VEDFFACFSQLQPDKGFGNLLETMKIDYNVFLWEIIPQMIINAF
jgi:hypothetical protein